MIILLPYGTDAPVYYWPYATIGTIVVNSLIFLFTFPMILMMDEREDLRAIVEFLILQFGYINPLQWITWNYMHADPLHLIGNMVALWSFGLIVEGKVGWWKFLAIYNGIGIFEGAVLQAVTMFFDEGAALGASGAIYGLMAIALVWAPFNEMQVFYWLFIRWFGTMQASVMTLVGFFIGMQVVTTIIQISLAGSYESGEEASLITTEILHLVGAGVGLVAGLAMLKLKWVDCEDFDVFSVWAGKHTRTEEEKREDFAKSEEGKALRARQFAQALAEFQQHMAAGQPLGALATHRRSKQHFPEWSLPENDFVQLIALLRKMHMYPQAVPTMIEYLRTYTERAIPVRLALAQVLIDHQQRPGQALAVLAKIDSTRLDATQRRAYESLYGKAEAAHEQDPYEVAPEDW